MTQPGPVVVGESDFKAELVQFSAFNSNGAAAQGGCMTIPYNNMAAWPDRGCSKFHG